MRQVAFSFIGLRNSFDPKEALVICADGRGGSTWLYEMLTNIPGVAGLWEPLHVGEVAHFRRLGFSYRHYINENDPAPEASKAFEALFRGSCREPYVMQRTSIREWRKADWLLVKFCRATQLLPWLEREFAFARKPVHLIRHPCAVVASQLRHGAWDAVQAKFNEREIFSDPLLRPHAETLLRIETVEARLAAIWAVTNAIAINHPERSKRWITVSYEDLVTDPQKTLSVILNDWGLSLENLGDIVSKPSETTHPQAPVAAGKQKQQLTYWQRTLEKHQIDMILNTVEALGLSIYGHNAKPDL